MRLPVLNAPTPPGGTMKNPRFVVGLVVLLAVLLGGGGLFLWTKNTPAAQEPIAEQPVSILRRRFGRPS